MADGWFQRSTKTIDGMSKMGHERRPTAGTLLRQTLHDDPNKMGTQVDRCCVFP
jgi:hypothetical protein